jgi:hypothetical protein
MIKVEFTTHPGEDLHALMREWAEILPWMKYLAENHTEFKYKIDYRADTHQNVVLLTFELPPAKETYYNLKYR